MIMAFSAWKKTLLNRTVPGNQVALGTMVQTISETVPTSVTLTVGTETSNHVDVDIALKGLDGNAVEGTYIVRYWIADSATGGEGTAATDISLTAGTLLLENTANVSGTLMTVAGGTATLRVSNSGAQTCYLRVALGNKVFTSSVITLA